MHQYYWQCVNHAATIFSSMEYWQFLDKKFKLYLTICKPGIKQVLSVEGHLQHLSNMQQFILYICYNRKCKAIIISMFLGFVFNWTPSSMWMDIMNIKNFRSEALMTATEKSTKCRNCFQLSVDSSVATWHHSSADNTVYDILHQWEQNVTFGDLHSFLPVCTFQCHILSVYKIDSSVFLGKPCYRRVTLTA